MATAARARTSKAVKAFEYGGYWLALRTDRGEWCICWNDPDAGFRRRIGTGIAGSSDTDPPLEAKQKLIAHATAAAAKAPARAQDTAQARVSPIMSAWLEREASKRARAAQYGYAVVHLERFFGHERTTGLLRSAPTIDDLTDERLERYIDFRKAEGIRGETIHGELATLRTAMNWAWKKRMISSQPYIIGVDKADRSGPREVEYSMEQVAALLEAAWRRSDRHHVHLFAMIMLSTHGRTEAVLELYSPQIRDGRIFFNADGRAQTTKKRSIVPVVPTLAPWLADVEGKVIKYRTPIAQRKWAVPSVPEYFERECFDIGNAFESCLVEAGTAHPSLQLCRPKLGEDGRQLVDKEALVWKGVGSPNALRHTVHTYLQTVGVPQAQIDAAAGHAGEQGSGRNYTHLRPEYLKDFVAAIEAYWAEMLHYTKVHVRSQVGPNVVTFDFGRKGGAGERL